MKEFINHLRAKDGLIYTLTYEENEFIEDLCSAIKKMTDNKNSAFKIPARIYTYSRPQGLYELDIINPLSFDAKRVNDRVRNYPELFAYIKNLQNQISKKNDNILVSLGKARNQSQEEEDQDIQPAIFIIKDLHLFFNDKDVLRWLRDLKESYLPTKKSAYCPIIVTSPVLELPPELEKIFTLFEYPLMSKDEIKEQFSKLIIDKQHGTEEELNAIAASLTGLTRRECLRAVMHSMASHDDKKVRASDLHEEKKQIVKKSGSLEFIVPQHTLEDMGGCDNFKLWIQKVKESMSEEARQFGVPQPKGAMLVGVPGTSKTVSAEILASYLGVPLLSLNIARVMGSFVGQSEHRILEALRIAKSVSPCVLLLDEMEKTLGGVNSSNQTDSGTLSRVMAQLLNFLQEDNTGIITIMTSNDVSQLPPELTRSGRIDAQWMFDLPNEFERSEIIDIYARKSNLILNDACHTYMVQATENFTGAEIKSAMKEVLVNVFYRQKREGVKTLTRDVTIEDIKDAVNNVVTVYKSSKEKIERFKAYASDRYLNASKTIDEIKAIKSAKSTKVLHASAPKKRILFLGDGD